jgi:hypothetical protein
VSDFSTTTTDREGESIPFVAFDHRLLDAARAEGIPVGVTSRNR